MIAQLTDVGGVLSGFELSRFNQGRLVALAVPFGSQIDVPSDLVAAAASHEDVLWAAPVFVREGSYERIWFTDEIVVALGAGITPEVFFAAGYDSWRPFFENQYVATVPGGALEALERASSLSLDRNVVWASPDWYADGRLATTAS